MLEASTPSHLPQTYFAPPGRDTPEDFARKVEIVRNSPLLTASLNAIPGMVMILNAHRQIVAANQAMLRVLQVGDHDLLEKRPGEVVGCVRPKEGPDGCGTSRHCATCGAVNAILDSQTQNAQVVRECRILTEGDSGPGAMDLRVAATPIEVEGERFILVAVVDISQPKRMAVLQRVFFHDVLNTAGCISGYADYLAKEHEAVNEVSELLTHLSEQLIEEINAQRDLVLAESGDLTLQVDMLVTKQVLDDLRKHYLKSPVAAERKIELGEVWNGIIWTDRRLLMRTGEHAEERLGGNRQGPSSDYGVLRSRRASRVCGPQPWGHAGGGAASDVPAVVQHEGANRARHRHLQHGTSRRAIPWREGRVRQPTTRRHDLHLEPSQVPPPRLEIPEPNRKPGDQSSYTDTFGGLALRRRPCWPDTPLLTLRRPPAGPMSAEGSCG